MLSYQLSVMQYRVDYFGFVYLWRDSETKRFYIGSHYGSTTDTYIASSKWLKAAYKKRPETFKRRVLQYLTTDDKKLLLQIEQAWLDLIKPHELSTSENVLAGTNRYYNMKARAAGGNGSANTGNPSCGMILTEAGLVGSNAFIWKAVSPSGEEFIVPNLYQFCKSRDLSKDVLYGAYRKGKAVGKRSKYCGWQLFLVNGIAARNR